MVIPSIGKALTSLPFPLLVLPAISFISLAPCFCLFLRFTHTSDTSDTRLILLRRLGLLHGLMAVVTCASLRCV